MWVESVEDYAKHMNQKDIVEAVMSNFSFHSLLITQFLKLTIHPSEDGANFGGEGAHVMIGYETLVLGEPVPGLPEDKNFRL